VTALPRVVVVDQQEVPGVDGAEVTLTLHAITGDNFTQRITIARRCRVQARYGTFAWSKWRNNDIALTRAQVLELIDLLIDRVDLMTDHTPGGTPV